MYKFVKLSMNVKRSWKDGKKERKKERKKGTWGLGINFLSKPVEEWHGIPAYQKFVTLVKSVSFTNDAPERIVKRSSDYKNIGSKSDLDFQATFKTVEQAIENVPSRKTKKALLKSYS